MYVDGNLVIWISTSETYNMSYDESNNLTGLNIQSEPQLPNEELPQDCILWLNQLPK